MFTSIILLVVGAVMIVWGADKLTDGASAMARRLNVSDLVIGMTVIAMGSSLPEFSVSLFSALKGSTGMAAGNIVGSNLFNTLVIIGVVAIITPLNVTRNTVRKDIPFTIAASLALLFLLKDSIFGGASEDIISRGDGLVLLIFFGIFMSYTFSLTKKEEPADIQQEASGKEGQKQMPWWKILLLILVGFCCLIGGGELFVDSASELARILGVSETVIGLTILAAGTSLPELAASIIAARKGSADMAIGNVVGSCLFNIFFILGTCSAITPMPVNDVNLLQLVVLALSGIMLLFFSYTDYKVKRWEGVIMTLTYIAFITYTVMV